MEIPRIWRRKKQYYQMEGLECPHCERKIFPPKEICPNCCKRTVLSSAEEGYMEVIQSTEKRSIPQLERVV